MHRPNPHIELQPPPTNPYQPQADEEESIQELPMTQCGGLEVEKANKVAVMLFFIIYTLDIIPLICVLNDGTKEEQYAQEFKDSLLVSYGIMSANLKADPIMEVQILDHGSTCPSDFQPLKLANWPGNVAGCLCENGDLKNSTCEQVDSPKCKTDIPSTFPTEMYEWDNSIFCVKRASLGTDYLKKGECPSDYKECYPGGCFKKDCPITKLEISSKEKYLISTRIPGELPLIDIQLTFGEIPCFNQDFRIKNITNSSYELSAVKENKCDKYGPNSQFSTKIDSQPAYDSFTENFFPYSVMHLPHFEKNANSTISVLSSMVRMKTQKHDYCLEINEKSIKDFLNEFPMFFAVFIVMFSLFSQGWSVFMRIIFYFEGGDINTANRAMMGFFYCSHFCSLFQILTEVIWFISVYLPFQTMKEDIQRYDSLGCFVGNQGQMVVSDYLEMIKKIEAGFSVHFYLFILSILPFLVLIWYYKAMKKLPLT